MIPLNTSFMVNMPDSKWLSTNKFQMCYGFFNIAWEQSTLWSSILNDLFSNDIPRYPNLHLCITEMWTNTVRNRNHIKKYSLVSSYSKSVSKRRGIPICAKTAVKENEWCQKKN